MFCLCCGEHHEVVGRVGYVAILHCPRISTEEAVMIVPEGESTGKRPMWLSTSTPSSSLPS